MKKNGFTLVELLVIILILGILTAIAVPSVSSIIDSSKRKTLKSSVLNIERIITQHCNEQLMDGEEVTTKYIIYNGEISGDVDIKSLPSSGEINVTKDCHVTVGIVEGNYCAVKRNNDVTINSNIYHCSTSEEDVPETKRACFVFNEDTRTIEGYNFANKSCPMNIAIPAKINGIPVEHIADMAFVKGNNKMMLVEYDSSVEYGNNSVNLDILENANMDGHIYEALIIDVLNPNMKKTCYYNNHNSSKEEPLNYVITNNDKYEECSFDISKYQDGKDYSTNLEGKIENVDFSKAYNLVSIGNASFLNNSIRKLKFESLPQLQSIGISAFQNNLISGKLDLSGLRNVKKIPYGSFYNNIIVELYLPSKLSTIERLAFAYNNIDFINLPTGLTRIEDYAFSGNVLSSLKVPETVEYLSGFNRNYIGELKISKSVKTIGIEAFYGNRLRKLNIPSNVEVIDDYAFYYNDITKLVVNEGIKEIRENAFGKNAISSIDLPSSLMELYPGAFTINNVPESQYFVYSIKGGITDKTTLISYAGAISPDVINIPNGVKVIEKNALRNTLASRINVPNSVTTIKSYAFNQHLMRGSSIYIGTGIQTIEPNAFYCNSNNQHYKEGYYCEFNISIKKKSKSISNYPWGNKYARINWTVK